MVDSARLLTETGDYVAFRAIKVPDMGDISTERSMEDILSSIKRIIAEEGDVGQRPPRRPRPAPVPTDPEPEMDAVDDAVLELADYADSDRESGIAATDTEAADPAPVSLVQPEAQPDPVEPAPRRRDEAFLSERTAQATRGSLDALSKLIVRPQATGSDTLEGLVRDMLRPMLSEWLDAHLPEIVERIVQREVERLTKR